MNAKRSAQEYDSISRGLIRGSTSVPLRGTPQESQQLLIWKRIINWERSNPARTEDQAVLVKRGMHNTFCIRAVKCRKRKKKKKLLLKNPLNESLIR